MGKSKIARRKTAALQARKAAVHVQEQHNGDAVQPVDTETAPDSQIEDGGPVAAPVTNGNGNGNGNGSMTPWQDKEETELDGTLTPTSAGSLHRKRASVGQRADMAESTGDIAEHEADDFSSVGGFEFDGAFEKQLTNGNGGTKPKHNGLSQPNGEIKQRSKPDARDTYPPLTDAAGKEAAARERDRINAYRAGGIRFAPWNIPYRRRLQTMAVLAHCLSIAMTVSFFFFLCAIPLTWPILIPYLLHMLLSKSATDGRLRARSERFRRLPVWRFFADYFPATLHKTHDLPPTRKYIFGYHPHGIISHGAFAAFGTDALGFADKFPGITNSLLTLDSNFRIPLYRDYILALGIQSVSKESITAILTTGGRDGDGMGRAVTIVVGGARESLEAHPGTMSLVLAQRKGFVKMAMRTGADLVPVLAFGENDLYDQLSSKRHPLLHRLQMWVLRTLKFTLPFLHGRGIFNYDVGLMPYRRPLNIVVGRPIAVRRAGEGEKKIEGREVERLHAEYVGELERMWGRYRGVFVREGEGGEMRILE